MSVNNNVCSFITQQFFYLFSVFFLYFSVSKFFFHCLFFSIHSKHKRTSLFIISSFFQFYPSSLNIFIRYKRLKYKIRRYELYFSERDKLTMIVSLFTVQNFCINLMTLLDSSYSYFFLSNIFKIKLIVFFKRVSTI